MRILYCSERPPYPFFLGGAARSAHYLMTHLARDLGQEVLAVGSRDFAAARWTTPPPTDFLNLGVTSVDDKDGAIIADCGYTVRVLPNFRRALRATLDAFEPDVVWAQLDGIETIANLARERGCRVVIFLRDAEDSPALLRALAAQDCCLLCNSRFMARRIRHLTGKTAKVIYPSLEADFGVRGDPSGFVTMINAHHVKGLETFLQVAQRMPQVRFLLVESWPLASADLAALKDRIRSLPNVTFWRRVSNAGAIYSQTRLILMPSVWEEAFGRVAIEAQSCGIPVIASRRGGLPEAVGRGGLCIDDYLNADTWVRAIADLSRDSAHYEKLSARALAHAGQDSFRPAGAARQFLDICQSSNHFRTPLALTLCLSVRRLLRITP